MTCVALLRGVNVGRAKRVAMADLRALLESLGHAGVRTLANSGNAVFRAGGGDAAGHAAAIERAIADRLGLSLAVVVITFADLEVIVAENPLASSSRDPSRLLVAFTGSADALAAASVLARRSWAPEAIAVGRKAAYVWCANGVGESRLFEALPAAAGAAMTMRNWATVLKLRALAAEVEAGGR